MGISSLVSAAVLALVVYLLWPTWRASAPNDPAHLPITIGSALFNVPAKAIRMRMQRRAGPQERIDLAFDYPSLAPPEPQAHVTADDVEDKPIATNRIFLSIAADGGVITPIERARTIYPRYVEAQADTQDGLTGRAFRDNSPYRGEDLFMADAVRHPLHARYDDARHVPERTPRRRRAPDVPLSTRLAVRLAQCRRVDGQDRRADAEQGELACARIERTQRVILARRIRAPLRQRNAAKQGHEFRLATHAGLRENAFENAPRRLLGDSQFHGGFPRLFAGSDQCSNLRFARRKIEQALNHFCGGYVTGNHRRYDDDRSREREHVLGYATDREHVNDHRRPLPLRWNWQ